MILKMLEGGGIVPGGAENHLNPFTRKLSINNRGFGS